MRSTRALAVAALAAVLTLSACSSGGDDDAGGDGNGAGDQARPNAASAPRDGVDGNLAEPDSLDRAYNANDEGVAPGETEKAIISKGNVHLLSKDVEKTVFDVQALVDKYGGEITERETGTDDEGDVRVARLLLRIPSKSFQDAFVDLEQVADLKSSNSTAEDVTTQVIDTSVRIRAQRRSLRRVEVLLDRATSIRDIVAIEAQLTRRQADLDSLEKRKAFLSDQTEMSTVTVNIERTPDEETKKKEKKDDDSGFLSGLDNGWHALVSFGTGLATVAGALLPWSIALLLVGGPLLLLVRRLRRRAPTPAAPEPADA